MSRSYEVKILVDWKNQEQIFYCLPWPITINLLVEGDTGNCFQFLTERENLKIGQMSQKISIKVSFFIEFEF